MNPLSKAVTHPHATINAAYKRICILVVVSPVRPDTFLACGAQETTTDGSCCYIWIEQPDISVAGQQGVLSPPMSHTLSLKPSLLKDLMLNPWVGMMCWISSSDKVFSMVVLPALSKPRTRMRASCASASPANRG